MRISEWSSDVCSSDLAGVVDEAGEQILRRRSLQHHGAVFGAQGALVGNGRLAGIQSILQLAGDLDVDQAVRSEERRVGKSVSVRVDLGGRRIIKNKTDKTSRTRAH